MNSRYLAPLVVNLPVSPNDEAKREHSREVNAAVKSDTGCNAKPIYQGIYLYKF